jgi:hypothetical protein
MDKRDITNAIVQIIVGAAVGAVVDKGLVALIPATGKFKVAEMTGMFAGWAVCNKYESQLKELVDNFYNKRETR